jgi:hypothetical protein
VATRLARLADLDPRWLYAALLLAIVSANFVSTPIRIRPGHEAQAFFDQIERLDGRKPVLLQSDWDMGTIGELRAQFYNVVRHLFRKNIRFVIVSGNALGPRFYRPAMEGLAREYGKEYGKDWISTGFKLPDPKGIAIEALSRDFAKTVVSDDLGRPVSDYPWLHTVRTAWDWALAITISYSEFREYITYFSYSARTPYLCGVASISSTQLYPFISSGTIKGMLVGARGGGEYEQAMGQDGYGSKLLIGQSAGHMLLLLAIVVGNLGQRAKARSGRQGD